MTPSPPVPAVHDAKATAAAVRSAALKLIDKVLLPNMADEVGKIVRFLFFCAAVIAVCAYGCSTMTNQSAVGDTPLAQLTLNRSLGRFCHSC